MKPYHKINSVFKRDTRGRFTDEFATPEIEYLANAEWIGEEKIDGTNVRIGWSSIDGVAFGGRSDNATIFEQWPDLLELIMSKFTPDALAETLKDAEGADVTLYGEGFGQGIQKGGGNYGTEKYFVLFDVLVGDWWLLPDAVDDIAKSFGVDRPAPIGRSTLIEFIERVKTSQIDSVYGNFPAEGIVLRPAVPMFTRRCDRIIAKLKTKDFEKQEAAS